MLVNIKDDTYKSIALRNIHVLIKHFFLYYQQIFGRHDR